MVEADEQSFKVVLSSLLDLASLDTDVIYDYFFARFKVFKIKTQGSNVLSQFPAVSSNDIKTPGSSYWSAPCTRNSIAKRVLPLPALPHTSVGRPFGSPPNVISSSP